MLQYQYAFNPLNGSLCRFYLPFSLFQDFDWVNRCWRCSAVAFSVALYSEFSSYVFVFQRQAMLLLLGYRWSVVRTDYFDAFR